MDEDKKEELYTVFGLIEPGEPLGAMAKKQLQRCSYCFKPAKKLQKCSGCFASWYCGKVCQTQDYKTGHKALCPALRKDYEASLKIAEKIMPVGKGDEPDDIDQALREWILHNSANLHVICQALCYDDRKRASCWNSYIGLVSRSTPSGVKLYVNHVYRVHHEHDPYAWSDEYFFEGQMQKIKPDPKIHYAFVSAESKSPKLHSLRFNADQMQGMTLPPSMPIEKFIILLNAGSLYTASNLIKALDCPRLNFEYHVIHPEGDRVHNAIRDQFSDLFTTTKAEETDREAFSKILDLLRDPVESVSLATRHDSINGYFVPKCYRPGVNKIFEGLKRLGQPTSPAGEDNTNCLLRCSTSAHRRMEELASDKTLGSDQSRAALGSIVSGMRPGHPFVYQSRYVFGMSFINMVPVPVVYETIIESLCARLEQVGVPGEGQAGEPSKVQTNKGKKRSGSAT